MNAPARLNLVAYETSAPLDAPVDLGIAPPVARLSLGSPVRYGWLIGPALLILYWSVLSVNGVFRPPLLSEFSVVR